MTTTLIHHLSPCAVPLAPLQRIHCYNKASAFAPALHFCALLRHSCGRFLVMRKSTAVSQPFAICISPVGLHIDCLSCRIPQKRGKTEENIAHLQAAVQPAMIVDPEFRLPCLHKSELCWHHAIWTHHAVCVFKSRVQMYSAAESHGCNVPSCSLYSCIMLLAHVLCCCNVCDRVTCAAV